MTMSSDTDASNNPIDELRLMRSYGIAVVGNELYVDGGQYFTKNFTGNTSTIHTFREQNWQQNDYLFSFDLTKSYAVSDLPPEEISNGSYVRKPGTLSTTGGAILSLPNNTGFVHLGGYPVSTSSVWYYDATASSSTRLSSTYEANNLNVYNGAYAISPLTGVAYYLGGLDLNQNPTSNLVAFDTARGNSSVVSQFPLGSIHGSSMVFLPLGSQGILVNIAGIITSSGGDANLFNPVDKVNVYDIASSSWYTQQTSGQSNPVRRSYACMVTPTPNSAQTHWEMILIGGANANDSPLDEVWALSVPSFQWFQYYKFQSGNADTFGKANQSCALIHDNFIGFVDTSPTTTPSGDPDKLISFFDITQLGYTGYDSSRTNYTTPLKVQVAIDGQNKPSGGFVDGLQPIFSRTIYSSNSTNPTSTPAATSEKSSHTGAIVGGVVGGILGLLLLAALVWFLIRRRKRKQNTTVVNYETPLPTPPPPQAPAAGGVAKPYHPQMAEVSDQPGNVHELGGSSVAIPYKPAIPPQELPGNEPSYRS